MKASKTWLLCLALWISAAPSARAEDEKEDAASDSTDSTQSLESPLGVGSGVTFAASKGEQSLTLGLSGSHGSGMLWQLGLEGKTEGEDSTSLFSGLDGLSAGVAFKAGVGFGSFEAQGSSSYEDGCKKYLDKVKATRHKERALKCIEEVKKLAVTLAPDSSTNPVGHNAVVNSAHGETCVAALVRLAEALSFGTANELAEVRALTPAAHEVLELRFQKAALAAHTSSEGTLPAPAAGASLMAQRLYLVQTDEAAAWNALSVGAKRTLLFSPTVTEHLESIESFDDDDDDEAEEVELPTCESIAETDEEQALYDELVKPYDGGLQYRVMLNALGEMTQSDYRPETGEEQFDLAAEKKYRAFLPGVSVDLVGYYRAFVAGLGLGYTRAVETEPVDVCSVVTSGAHEARDCSKATLGKPEATRELFATATIQIVPPSFKFGTLVPGAQLFGRAATKSSDDLFGSQTWNVLVSLPLFVTAADTPGGLRAGLAPEVTIPTESGKKTDFALALFVGSRFRPIGASQKE